MPKIDLTTDDKKYKCAKTGRVMIDPVEAADNKVYERFVIKEWLRHNDTSPITEKKLDNKKLRSIPIAKAYIDSFLKSKGVCTLEEFWKVIRSGDVEKIKQLNYLDSHLQARNFHGKTPLFWAAEKEKVGMVKFLLAEGAEVNGTVRGKCTPLHIATSNLRSEVVEQLIKAKANVNVKDKKGRTPLHYATIKRKGQHEIVKWLLAAEGAEASVSAVDKYGNASLHYAAVNNNVEVLKLLLSTRGIKLNIRNKESGNTALHRATKFGYYDIVNLLLLFSADCNIHNKDGKNTPLHIAAERNYPEIARLLLQNNANYELTNEAGQTAVEVAVQHQHFEVVKLIQQHIKRLKNPAEATFDAIEDLRYEILQLKTMILDIKSVISMQQLFPSIPNSEDENLMRVELDLGIQERDAICKRLPEDLSLGKAVSSETSFFDALAQGLNQLLEKEEYSAEELRLMCSGTHKLTPHIKGRPHIEGKALCKKIGFTLHIISIQEVDENDNNESNKVSEEIINEKGRQVITALPKNDYDKGNMVHLVAYGNCFVPILKKELLNRANGPVRKMSVVEKIDALDAETDVINNQLDQLNLESNGSRRTMTSGQQATTKTGPLIALWQNIARDGSTSSSRSIILSSSSSSLREEIDEDESEDEETKGNSL